MTNAEEFQICGCKESQYLRAVLGWALNHISNISTFNHQSDSLYNSVMNGFQIENYINIVSEDLRLRSNNDAVEQSEPKRKEGKQSGQA